ncbi:Uncharacterized protein TCM_045743 [Theobroma cacao]|uniref:Uncharacterized protein n=1 Tax=Theobroma cacao TaxID=3641 RepID=S1S3P3_THECC|nr:Uncharacterized protein TCM_045743 [Theobroma cacao]
MPTYFLLGHAHLFSIWVMPIFIFYLSHAHFYFLFLFFSFLFLSFFSLSPSLPSPPCLPLFTTVASSLPWVVFFLLRWQHFQLSFPQKIGNTKLLFLP